MKDKMKNRYIGAILLVVAFLALVSCDYDLDKVNPNSVTIQSYYNSDEDLTKAVNATYAVLQNQQLVGREWFFVHDLRGDDMATGGGQLETPRYQLLIGTNDPANGVANNVWNGCFAVIHRANVVIEKAPGIPTTNEALHNRLVGEAKFLRGWAYYELVSLWGGVPLHTEYVKELTGAKPRAKVEEVYAQIIKDLQDAIGNLPLSFTGNDMGRATKGAARALLARAYMQKGDYASAKTQLQEIANSNQYRLVDNFSDNFLEETEYNSESVFEIGFMDSNGSFNWSSNNGDGLGSETTIHNQEFCPISWGNLIPSKSLIEEFETTEVAGNTKTDPRYKDSFYEVGDKISTGPLTLAQFNIASSVIRNGAPKKIGWRKHTILYKNASSYYPSGNNERVIRYAEVLLMLAECLNETGSSEAEVLSVLNKIRDRASVIMPHYPTPNYPTNTKDARFKAIVHEKRIELAGEEIRNRDILRWRQQGKLAILGGDPISYFQSNKFELLPIPQSEIDNNVNIGKANQNPGY